MRTSPPIQKLAHHYDVKLDAMRYWRKMLLKNPLWEPDQAYAIDQSVFTPHDAKNLNLVFQIQFRILNAKKK